MKKKRVFWIVGGTITTVIILAVGLAFLLNNTPKNPSSGTAIKFSNTSYYSHSYQIFPWNNSSEAVLNGFNVTIKNNTLGGADITISPLNSSSPGKKYILQRGQKLYFIDQARGDDVADKDNFGGDDLTVIVNSQGYMLPGPSQI